MVGQHFEGVRLDESYRVVWLRLDVHADDVELGALIAVGSPARLAKVSSIRRLMPRLPARRSSASRRPPATP